MGQQITKNFQNRFEDRISVSYREKSIEPAEQQIRSTRIVKAFTQILTGILKREPTKEELLGIVDISARKHLRKT